MISIRMHREYVQSKKNKVIQQPRITTRFLVIDACDWLKVQFNINSKENPPKHN